MSAVHQVVLHGYGPDEVVVVTLSSREIANKVCEALKPIVKQIEIFADDYRKVEHEVMKDFSEKRDEYEDVLAYINDRTVKIKETLKWDENFQKYKDEISKIVSFEDDLCNFSEYQLESMMQWGQFTHVSVRTYQSFDERINKEFLNE